jgi:hypothetical protein
MSMTNAGAAGEVVPVIQENILDDTLRSYLQELIENRPFSFDIVIDERHVRDNVAAHWPHEAADLAQAEPFWKLIDEVVQSIPAIKTTPTVVLRVIASASPLVPQSIPSPHNHAALATFNATDGKFQRTVLPGTETLPPLVAMKVPAGLMVITQPVPPLVNQFSDNRGEGLGAGNIYTERTRDAHPPQDKVDVATDAPPPPPLPENKLG